MGKLEQEMRTRTRNTKITRAILTALAVAAVGVLNPRALVPVVLRALNVKKDKYHSTQNNIYAARKRLLERGLIEYREGFLRTTERGKLLMQRQGMDDNQQVRPRRWDKKWRILIFDIREKRRALREKVRRTLVALGFKRLQDSVWVYPYDCEDLIVLLKADFRIGKDLLYIIADTVENDSVMKKEFGLV